MHDPNASGLRPRVLMVAHSLDAADGGMETVHVELMAHLAHEVEFVAIATRLDPRLVGLVEWHRIRVPSRPAPLRFVLFFLVASLSIARLRRGGVVHACGAIVVNRLRLSTVHTVSAAIVAARGGALASPDAPLVRRVNSATLRWLALRAEAFVYRPNRTDLLAAVSETTAKELHQFYPGTPVVITPNGVDHGRFHPDPDVRRIVRHELGLGDEVVALFVGGDFDRKGLGIAIESLSHAPSVTLVVAGSGDLERARQVAARSGVERRVILLGPRLDVERLDQMADLYLCASIYEADSLALLEAAATGLALISTRVGSAERFIGEGDDAGGVLVERTAGAIGEALEQLAADEAHRAHLGTQARRRAEARRWSEVARQVLALYA